MKKKIFTEKNEWEKMKKKIGKQNETMPRRTDERSLDSLEPPQPENVFEWSHFSQFI